MYSNQPTLQSVRVYCNDIELLENKDFVILEDGTIKLLNPSSTNDRYMFTYQHSMNSSKQIDLNSHVFDHFLKPPKNIKPYNKLPGSNHFGSKRKKGKR